MKQTKSFIDFIVFIVLIAVIVLTVLIVFIVFIVLTVSLFHCPQMTWGRTLKKALSSNGLPTDFAVRHQLAADRCT